MALISYTRQYYGIIEILHLFTFLEEDEFTKMLARVSLTPVFIVHRL